MLQPEDEKEVQVLKEDQSRINQFSKLTSKVGGMEEEYAKLKEEKEYLEELMEELELADEDEPINFRIGDSFVGMPLSEAQERLKKEWELIDSKVSELRASIEEAQSKMVELKVTLYAKFGNTIHLEKD